MSGKAAHPPAICVHVSLVCCPMGEFQARILCYVGVTKGKKSRHQCAGQTTKMATNTIGINTQRSPLDL